MKWDKNTPFYKQNLFWIGTTALFLFLALVPKINCKVIICGNNNSSNLTHNPTT